MQINNSLLSAGLGAYQAGQQRVDQASGVVADRTLPAAQYQSLSCAGLSGRPSRPIPGTATPVYGYSDADEWRHGRCLTSFRPKRMFQTPV